MLNKYVRVLAAVSLLSLWAWPALAALSNAAVFLQTPKAANVQFLAGTDSAGTYKTLYTGATNGSKISGLWMTTSDGTATHLVTCQYKSGAVFFGGVSVVTVLSAGFAAGVPAINMMAPANWPGLPTDADGNPYLYLNSADTFQCTFATALTAATVVNLTAVAADF